MPEDAQPNDFRGRQAHKINVQTTRPNAPRARNARNSSSSSARPSLKRRSDRSLPSSPAKRRKIETGKRPEIREEFSKLFPPECRKNQPDRHRERREFIAREIAHLQQARPGLTITHRIHDANSVFFYVLEPDLLHTSLAPIQAQQLDEPSVESPPQDTPLYSIISTIAGPPRVFKSGSITLKFSREDPSKPILITPPSNPNPVAQSSLGKRKSPLADARAQTSRRRISTSPIETVQQRTAVSRSPMVSQVKDLSPVAELLFGKQGLPTKASSSTASTSRLRKSTSPNEVVTVPRSSVVSEMDLDDDELPPVAELLFGKQGLPPSKAASPADNLAKSRSPLPQTQAPMIVDRPSPPRTKEKDAASTPSVSESIDLSLSDTDEPPIQVYNCQSDGDELRIPTRQQHDKLRRFLYSPGSSTSFVVSAHGLLEGIDVAARKNWLISQDSGREAIVDDACLVDAGNLSIPVVGYSRDEQQLSLMKIDGDGVVSAIDLKRPWNSKKKGGVSAVAPMMQPLSFASGGYDHVVHFWRLGDDLSSASAQHLNIKHNSQVQSLLAIHDSSHKLLSAGADCSVHFWDLGSERVVHTLRPSSSVYHVHPTSSPFCTLLEVAHRELQFEIRDHRTVPASPVQRFGYACPQFRFHGRYMKGTTLSNCFASGDRAGNVRLWDLRNTKTPRSEFECFPGQKMAHVVSHSSQLFACSQNNQIRFVKL
ncbi:WD40-repeat-containing domain protein [Roridomyces roridus]|uniref:WD40-repeat-containing domain protein n=1 Tax=Roridomyces roridus TaxID=1738132 RepID=A0AAD7C684_9AGAR|nr:WD40-repeat-containing domain protein [Roridomyces roridus]